MYEVEQLATAMMVVVFAAVMIVVGHLYMENQARNPPPPSANAASQIRSDRQELSPSFVM